MARSDEVKGELKYIVVVVIAVEPQKKQESKLFGLILLLLSLLDCSGLVIFVIRCSFQSFDCLSSYISARQLKNRKCWFVHGRLFSLIHEC